MNTSTSNQVDPLVPNRTQTLVNALVAIVVELVVGPEGGERAHADGVREEDLRGARDPRLAQEDLVPVDAHVVGEAVPRAGQRERAPQQDEHDEVGEEGREPDDLGNEKAGLSFRSPERVTETKLVYIYRAPLRID